MNNSPLDNFSFLTNSFPHDNAYDPEWTHWVHVRTEGKYGRQKSGFQIYVDPRGAMILKPCGLITLGVCRSSEEIVNILVVEDGSIMRPPTGLSTPASSKLLKQSRRKTDGRSPFDLLLEPKMLCQASAFRVIIMSIGRQFPRIVSMFNITISDGILNVKDIHGDVSIKKDRSETGASTTIVVVDYEGPVFSMPILEKPSKANDDDWDLKL